MMLGASGRPTPTPSSLLSWQMLADLHQRKQLEPTGPLRHGKQTLVLQLCRGE